MAINPLSAKDIDEYIASFPVNVQEILNELRSTIKKAAPDAQETISYKMPAYMLIFPLVYFGAYKNHIGFYLTGSGIENFKKELSAYEGSKGTMRFRIDQLYDLISKMFRFRVKENMEKAELKKAMKNSGKV